MLETPLNILPSLVVVGKIVIHIYDKLVSQVGRQQLIFYSVKRAQNTGGALLTNPVLLLEAYPSSTFILQ